MDSKTEQAIRRFLLGESVDPLPSWDPEVMEIVETDLIDSYLQGGLSGDELRQFESHYLRQEGRSEKVKVAAAFQRWVRPTRRPWMRIGRPIVLAAAAVLATLMYWQASTLTLYPGGLRDASGGHPVIHRFLPRRIQLAIINPIKPGHLRATLRNPEGEVWNTDLELVRTTEYLTITVPIWTVAPDSYSIELQAPGDRGFRTIAYYPITIE